MAVGRSRVVRLEVEQARGTGFLLAPDLLLTSAHVVARVSGDRLDPRGTVGLFYGASAGPHDQPDEWLDTLDVVASDARADWVVLRVAGVDGQHVWPVARVREIDSDRRIATFGFNVPAGAEASGTLETTDAPEDAAAGRTRLRRLQLFARQAAAGDGQPMDGYSGAPVVIDGFVVGVLVRAAVGDSDKGTVRGGTVYGRPIDDIAQALDIEVSALPGPRFEGPPNATIFEDTRETRGLFIGREVLLEQLRTVLPSGDEARTVALVGMPGVGKSFLADHFAQLHRARFRGGVLRVVLEAEELRRSPKVTHLCSPKVDHPSSTRAADRDQQRPPRWAVVPNHGDPAADAPQAPVPDLPRMVPAAPTRW